jgi:ketosteroid isomerase-like protein
MSASDAAAVRTANQGFYRAFESLSLERMDAVWAHDGQVMCVHPGWPLAEGWPAVRRTWETIFRNTREIRFEVAEQRLDVRGELAWVVCVERLSSSSDRRAVLATNVLRRGTDGAWRMVHHHGSPLVAARSDRSTAPPAKPIN